MRMASSFNFSASASQPSRRAYPSSHRSAPIASGSRMEEDPSPPETESIQSNRIVRPLNLLH